MFVTVFDEAYARWGRILLASLMKYHPNVPVLVLGVNLSPETADVLIYTHSNITLRTRTLEQTGPDRGVLIANSRPLWLRELAIEIDPDWICLLDADLLFRRPLDDLLAQSAAYAGAFVVRSGVLHGRKYRRLRVAAGLVLLRRSGYSLIDLWCSLLDRTEPIEDVVPGGWFWEQTCLADVFDQTELTILPIQTPKYLSSPPFADEAVVWSANVKAHEKDAIFAVIEAEWERLNAEGIHSVLERRSVPRPVSFKSALTK